MNMHELQMGCRTYRRFKQEAIPEEILNYALENARIANCSVNLQQLRYIAVTSKSMTEQIQALVKYAAALPPEIGMPKKDEQPTAFIAVVQTGQKSMVDIDTGIAVHAITLSLYEKGYGSCILGNISRKKICCLLDIKEDEKLPLLIAIGKPMHSSEIVEMQEGDCKYYVDSNRNYYVPKRAYCDIVKFV